MGMFDYVRCEMDLPDDPKLEGYQTKDTPAQWCEFHTIGRDGKIRITAESGETCSPPELENFTGDIYFYTFGKDTDDWHEYLASFKDGVCPRIVKMGPEYLDREYGRK